MPVSGAEPVVSKHRQHMDSSASWGVPAHVTVLSPFLPPEAVNDEALDLLSRTVASVDAFDCTFATTGWFGTDVLWLAPQSEEPLRRLTAAVWAAFPAYPPYGGAFSDVVPHLTVAECALGGFAALRDAEAEVRPSLPFSQRLDHALLITGSQQPHSWRTLKRLDLGNG